jgi:hypothetical protein
MLMPPAEKDERPWDLRLVQWMSRGSAAKHPRGSTSPHVRAVYAVIYWVAAAISRDMFWVWVALALTLLSLATYAWVFAKRVRQR